MMRKIGFLLVLLLVVGWTVYDTLYAESKTDEIQGEGTRGANVDEELSLDELRSEWLVGLDIDGVELNGDSSGEQADANESVGPRLGDKAPDFRLPTLTGETLALSDLKGKKVILNLWATWCPPCREEMPDMQKIYEEMGRDEVEIIAVNLTQSERNKADVKAFVEEYGLTFPVLLDEKSEVAQAYFAITIPTSYIIDSEGIIQKKKIGPMTYDWMKEALQNIN